MQEKVRYIRSKINKQEVELHFLRTLGQNERFRNGGLYITLSERYIKTAATNDHNYSQALPAQTTIDPLCVLTEATDIPESSNRSNLVPDSWNRGQPVYHAVQQKTNAWFELRQGLLTASICGTLLGKALSANFTTERLDKQ